MMLVIDTQDRENYAAHNGFTGEYYWKMKGGQSVKVINIPKGVDPSTIVEAVRSDIEDLDNNYFRSEIIDYNLQEDGWLSCFERSQLEYEGIIVAPEPTIDWSKAVANAH
jgi:hypothetical protein